MFIQLQLKTFVKHHTTEEGRWPARKLRKNDRKRQIPADQEQNGPPPRQSDLVIPGGIKVEENSTDSSSREQVKLG